MTLFEAILRLVRTVSVVRMGTATSGTTTTLTDTTHTFRTGEFQQGTIFFLSGDNAGHTRRVISYDGSKFTFSPVTDQTNPPVGSPQDQPILVGDRYAVADKDYQKDLLIQAVNSAIRLQYPLPIPTLLVGANPLLTVASQDEYTVNAARILRVEIATSLTLPYKYQVNRHWDQALTTLRFDSGFAPASDDYKMRLTYETEFTDLADDDDIIAQEVNLNVLHWQAIVELDRMGLLLYKSDPERQLANILNEAYGQLARINRRPVMQRDPKLAGW